MTKCCRNCANLIDYPKNNRYGDVNHLCIVTGYFATGIDSGDFICLHCQSRNNGSI